MTWFQAHPELAAAIVWPVVSAILTALFYPRSEAELEQLSPRVAAMLRAFAAMGVDVPKLVLALKEIFSPTPQGPGDDDEKDVN